MVFEKETLAMPSLGELRERFRSYPFRRNFLWAGVVLSLAATGAALPQILSGGGQTDQLSVARVEFMASEASPSEVSRLAAQVRDAVLSPVSLGLAVSDLQLQPQDFGGSSGSSRLGFLMNMLFEDQGSAAVAVNPAERGLEQSITLVPSQTGMEISVAAVDGGVSQKVTDYLAKRVVEETARRGHEPGLQVLDRARGELDRADAALAGFQMRHGGEAVSRIKNAQDGLRDVEARISTLAPRSESIKEAVASLSGMKREEMLAKALPDLPALAPMEAARQSYETARLALAEVNIDYGPKHPKAIAAQSAVDAARADVSSAAKQALATLKRDEAAAIALLDNAVTERSALDEQLAAMGDAPAELSRLEAGLDKARRDYLAASEKAGPFARAPAITASIAHSAAPAAAGTDDFLRMMTSICGAAIGVLLALFLLSFKREEEEDTVDAIGQDAVMQDEAAFAPAVETVLIEPDIFDDTDDVFDDAVTLTSVASQEDEQADAPLEIAEFDEVEAANDFPLDERVRHVLMRNAVRADEEAVAPPAFKLPPLLAAALAGEAEHAEADTHELNSLREELALLKQRVRERAYDEEVLRKSA